MNIGEIFQGLRQGTLQSLVEGVLREVRVLLHNRKKVENIDRPLVVIQAGVGDFILSFLLIQIAAQGKARSVDVLTTDLAAPIAELSPWIRDVIVWNGKASASDQVFEKLSAGRYTTVYSVRTSILTSRILMKCCPAAFFVLNPVFETLRPVSRTGCIVSAKFKWNYWSNNHMERVYASLCHRADLNVGSKIILNKQAISQTVNDLARLLESATIVHVGGSSPIRRLHPEVLARVINELKSVVLVGHGQEDGMLAEQIARISINKNVHDMVNNFSLIEVFQLMSHSSLCIAPDSSIMHLAACCDIPIIALMGNSRPGSFGPVRKKNVCIIDFEPECSPCGREQCGKYQGRSCVQAIGSDEILGAVRRLAPNVMCAGSAGSSD